MKKINITFLIFMIISTYVLGCYFEVTKNTTSHANAATQDAYMFISPQTQSVSPGEEFEVQVFIDNSASNQNIITAGFDLSYPTQYLEVIDADSDSNGIQIDITGNDFQFNEPELNTVTNGIINFTAGNQGTNPVNKSSILVGTIQFKAKANITSRIVELNLLDNTNTGAFITDNQGIPQNIIDIDTGLGDASVVISTVSFELSPTSSNIKIDTDFTVDVILKNPDQVDIITFQFTLNFDNDRLVPQNIDDKMEILIDDAKGFQVVENSINDTGTIKLTGGFTDKNNDTTLPVASITFNATTSGRTHIEFDENLLLSSVYTVDNAINNFLGSTIPGSYQIGEVEDDEAPESTARPGGGTYFTTQTVTLSADDNTDNDPVIYYTTDGSTPNRYSSTYRNPIVISGNTTLKFYAEDEDGNKENPNTEIYNIGTGNYAIGITPVKNQVNPGEIIGIIAKLIDTTVNRAVPNKAISFTSSKGAIINMDSTAMTDEEGEIIAEYTAPNTPGIDTIEATLISNPETKAFTNIEVIGANISKLTLVAVNIDTTKPNYISVTAFDNDNQKITNSTPIQLDIKNTSTQETKTYYANTNNGVATFEVQGQDFQLNTEYEFIAQANGVYSNTVKLNTHQNNGGSNNSNNTIGTYRPGGGGIPPETGPKETLLAIFLISIGSVFFLNYKKA